MWVRINKHTGDKQFLNVLKIGADSRLTDFQKKALVEQNVQCETDHYWYRATCERDFASRPIAVNE